MEISKLEVNEKDYCKFNFRVEAEGDAVSSKKQEVITKFKDLDVPGFRKKKATQDAIRIHYAKQIAEALTSALAEDAYNTAIQTKNMKPFGRPQFSIANVEGSRFVCEFSLHTQPVFELKAYKNFEIPKPADPISSDEFAQKILQDLRTRFGTTNQYTETDFVQLGDSVILDYSATSDGQPIEALKASGEVVQVGKTPIEGFDTNLLGMNAGEEREFVVNIPESSGVKELAGKPVLFKAKLLTGSKITPAPLDIELAKKFNLDTIDLLMTEVSSTATTRINEIRDSAIFNQISHRLVDNHDFKVPDWISTAEAQIKARSQKQDWEKMSDAEKEVMIKSAEDSVKLSLILEKVRAEEPEAQLTDEEAFNTAKNSFSKMSGDPEKMLQSIMSNGQLPLLMNHVRDEFTLGFIKNNCTIVE